LRDQGFRVWGLGLAVCVVHVEDIRVPSLPYMYIIKQLAVCVVHVEGLRVQGLGFRVWGLGLAVCVVHVEDI
jgi:hypothetical protein